MQRHGRRLHDRGRSDLAEADRRRRSPTGCAPIIATAASSASSPGCGPRPAICSKRAVLASGGEAAASAHARQLHPPGRLRLDPRRRRPRLRNLHARACRCPRRWTGGRGWSPRSARPSASGSTRPASAGAIEALQRLAAYESDIILAQLALLEANEAAAARGGGASSSSRASPLWSRGRPANRRKLRAKTGDTAGGGARNARQDLRGRLRGRAVGAGDARRRRDLGRPHPGDRGRPARGRDRRRSRRPRRRGGQRARWRPAAPCPAMSRRSNRSSA